MIINLQKAMMEKDFEAAAVHLVFSLIVIDRSKFEIKDCSRST